MITVIYSPITKIPAQLLNKRDVYHIEYKSDRKLLFMNIISAMKYKNPKNIILSKLPFNTNILDELSLLNINIDLFFVIKTFEKYYLEELTINNTINHKDIKTKIREFNSFLQIFEMHNTKDSFQIRYNTKKEITPNKNTERSVLIDTGILFRKNGMEVLEDNLDIFSNLSKSHKMIYVNTNRYLNAEKLLKEYFMPEGIVYSIPIDYMSVNQKIAFIQNTYQDVIINYNPEMCFVKDIHLYMAFYNNNAFLK